MTTPTPQSETLVQERGPSNPCRYCGIYCGNLDGWHERCHIADLERRLREAEKKLIAAMKRSEQVLEIDENGVVHDPVAEAAERRAQEEGWVNLSKVPTDPMLWALCPAADVCRRCVAGNYKTQDGVPWTCGNYLQAAEDYRAMLSAAPAAGEKEKP